MERMKSWSTVAVVSLVGAGALAAEVPAPPPLPVSRAALRLETEGERSQRVTVDEPGGEAVGCQTPCALEVVPGARWLRAEGPGLRTAQLTVQVPAEGVSLRLREATRPGFVGGVVLTAFGASALVSMGGAVLAVVASGGAGDSYNQMMMAIMGTMGAVLGLPSLGVGLWMLHRHQPGVASAAPPSAVSWQVVPTASPDGPGVALTGRF